jgi:hypothetical protein
MGHASSILDCATNPLDPLPVDGEDFVDHAGEPDASDGDAQLPGEADGRARARALGGGADALSACGEPQPLRDCALWRLQRAFYSQSAARAWTEGVVPHFVSSNSFLARAYAKVAIGLMRDAAAAGAAGPLTILEVGAGHGKLGYLIVESLLRFRAFLPPLVPAAAAAAAGAAAPPFRYILTDAVAANVEAMRAHPSLRDFIAQGIVDTAVWDADDEGAAGAVPSITLASGRELSPESLAGAPLLVVSNYTLNSLRTDAFKVPRGGGLAQACVSLSAPAGPRRATAALSTAADTISRLEAEWSYAPLGAAGSAPNAAVASGEGAPPVPITDADLPAPYADDPVLGALLRGYAQASGLRGLGGMVLIPLGGLAMLRSLLALSRGRLVVLIGDKGHSYLGEMADGGRDPHLARHGSFSFMVNFHAIRLWTRAYGGEALVSPQVEGFKTCVLCFGGDIAAPLPPPGPSEGAECPRPVAPIRHSASTYPAPAPKVLRGAVSQEASGREMLASVAKTLWSDAAASAALPLFRRPQGSEPCVTANCSDLPAPPPLPASASEVIPVLAPGGCSLSAYPILHSSGPVMPELLSGLPQTLAIPPPADLSSGPGGFEFDDDAVDLSVRGGYCGAGLCGVNAGGGASDRFAATRAAAAEILRTFTPEDFAMLQRGIKEECPAPPTLKHALSLLRLSQHDSEVFLKFKQVLIDKTVAPSCPENLAKDVRFDVERVYAGYFPLQSTKDVNFDLGRVCMGMRDYPAAIEFFNKSNELCGQHHVTWHNMGICYFFCSDISSASSCFTQALALNAEYAESRRWLDRMQHEREPPTEAAPVSVAATEPADESAAVIGAGTGAF